MSMFKTNMVTRNVGKMCRIGYRDAADPDSDFTGPMYARVIGLTSDGDHVTVVRDGHAPETLHLSLLINITNMEVPA